MTRWVPTTRTGGLPHRNEESAFIRHLRTQKINEKTAMLSILLCTPVQGDRIYAPSLWCTDQYTIYMHNEWAFYTYTLALLVQLFLLHWMIATTNYRLLVCATNVYLGVACSRTLKTNDISPSHNSNSLQLVCQYAKRTKMLRLAQKRVVHTPTTYRVELYRSS